MDVGYCAVEIRCIIMGIQRWVEGFIGPAMTYEISQLNSGRNARHLQE